MVRLREINVKAQFAFSPISTAIITATAAGSLSDDLSDEASLELYDLALDADEYLMKPKISVPIKERCRSIAWGGVGSGHKQGVIAAAMESTVDLYDAEALANGKEALLTRGTAHTGQVRCLDFSQVQKHLLATAGTKGEFFVWDVSAVKSAPTAYKSSRLDEIVSIAWNNKVGHILALGGKSGALSVWDLRKKAELIHIPTRFPVAAIAWHPSKPTILTTSSADDANPIIQVWDLQNANAPRQVLQGHERGVLSLAWCAADPDLLLSSGADNRTLIWNPSTAQLVAELPASSQWVHRVDWCNTQPSIIANATLDGKLNIYSIQDTKTPEAAAAVPETTAGDDFFDSIPKNYQAQTTSFTLKQTPAWLKRPVSARFGFGGRLAMITNNKVQVVTYQASTRATLVAKDIKETISSKPVADLCQEQQTQAEGDEKSEWDIIKTLTADDTRKALLAHLGLPKEGLDDELAKKLKDCKLQDQNKDDVFGDDDLDDAFAGIQQTHEPFQLSAGDDTDKLITTAIMSGRFDAAVDVCLRADRLSDAFMLALCGAEADRTKVQKAYFAKTQVPYKRLLNNIIVHNLDDVIEHADLADWKQALAIICNYATPAQFPDLCEKLGKRLEAVPQVQNATLCYLAGAKLEHLVPIWQQGAQARKEALLASGEEKAPFEVHVAQLGEVMVKVQIFRRSVTFKDAQLKKDGLYPLAKLYDLYLEFAGLLAAEGNVVLAHDYLELVPLDYDGAESLKKRITGPTSSSSKRAHQPMPQLQQQQHQQPFLPYGSQQLQPTSAQKLPPPVPQQGPVPARTTSAASKPSYQSPYAPPQPHSASGAQSPVPQGPYAPQNAQTGPYAPTNTFAGGQPTPSPYGAPPGAAGSTYHHGPYGGVQGYGQQPGPPFRNVNTGPTMLPAAQRKDIPNWNDAPDMPQPANRGRATPVIHRQISQQLPYGSGSGSATPPMAGAGQASLASPGMVPPPPPPKTKSPPPPRAATSSIDATISSTPPPIARASSYAPQPGVQVPYQTGQPPAQSSAPPSRYQAQTGPPPQQSPYQTGPPPQQHLYGAPPPPQQKSTFAPPPKAATVNTSGPPLQGRKSPVISSPVSARPIALSREPSQQGMAERRQQQQTIEAVMQYPPGDRSHIPENNRVILTSLLGETDRFGQTAAAKYQRPLADALKKLNVLFDQLNNGILTDSTVEQVKACAAALVARDYASAYKQHLELTADKMHECREWIVAVKTLIAVGKNTP